jgi:enoyl-CoA hydratase
MNEGERDVSEAGATRPAAQQHEGSNLSEAGATRPGTEHCTWERVGTTLVVTMDRPEARNALSAAMLVGLFDAWREIDANPDIRCGVLTGAGGNFCAGADLKSMFGGGGDNPHTARWADEPDLHWKALLRNHAPTKPIVAAVEGYAVAGGTEILQGTHLRVAGESATFGLFEAKRGLFPQGGSTVRLRRQVGYTAAMEMLLTARAFSAAEALAMGLVGRVVPDGRALDTALQLAAVIGANGPLAIEAIIRSVRETECLPEEAALVRELEIGWPIFSTEDAKEGARAFAEHRTPDFRRR